MLRYERDVNILSWSLCNLVFIAHYGMSENMTWAAHSVPKTVWADCLLTGRLWADIAAPS